MAFHDIPGLVEEQLEQARSFSLESDVRKLAPSLHKYYKAKDETAKGLTYAHAVLTYLTADNYTQAGQIVSATRGINLTSAEALIMNALNVASPEFKALAALHERRGLIVVGARFYKITPELEQNGEVQTAKKQINSSFLPILEKAIAYALVGGNDRGLGVPMGMRTLRYLAAQLMPEGKEKEARLSALSVRDSKLDYNRYLGFSREAIKRLSADMEIVVPEGLLRPKAVATQAKDIAAKQSENFTTAALPSSAGYDPKDLRDTLVGFAKAGKINREEGLWYMYLQSGEARTEQDTAAHFGVHVGVIVKAKEKVISILNGNDSSNVDRHEPRAIRPQ